MRILTVHPGPHFSVADVHNGWVKAFGQLGAEVKVFNLHDRLTFYETAGSLDPDTLQFEKMLTTEEAIGVAAHGIEADCYRFWPDVLFVVSGFFVPAVILDVVRARGTKVVLLHTEEPYEVGRELARAEHADLNLVNDPTYLDRFQALGPAFYSPHCYDPDIHHPAPAGPDDVSDFAFVGTGYPSRIDFLEQVDWTGIDVALGGNWQGLHARSQLRKFVCHDLSECLDNADAVNLYRGAKMSANLYRTEADRPELSEGWAMGPREVELAATGCPFLRQPRPEGDEVLGMLPVFDGPEDFTDKLRWHLARPVLTAELARQAREAVADRTFAASARGLLNAVEKL